ncbi:PTS sugar transporter subunit IIA [Robertmurraya sp. Marseille-Q9965]
MFLSRLTKELVQFQEKIDSWEKAIELASNPLLENGSINESYVKAMIENVKNFGPYIVLMPQVAMPHARPEDGVITTGISLLVVKEKVLFETDKSANLFLVLAAENATNHLTLLQEISDFLSKEENIERLLSATNYEEFLHNHRGNEK